LGKRGDEVREKFLTGDRRLVLHKLFSPLVALQNRLLPACCATKLHFPRFYALRLTHYAPPVALQNHIIPAFVLQQTYSPLLHITFYYNPAVRSLPEGQSDVLRITFYVLHTTRCPTKSPHPRLLPYKITFSPLVVLQKYFSPLMLRIYRLGNKNTGRGDRG
jgi:hypothetical protein